ncbi:hypothetical protein [Criibacterium bergeronii]|uniref:hypothetical protein n=1 Tax=Criibacterium bergeronii TaxID=1871336 RepID=UPI00163DD8D3|nr:hypothetical protein [Criibacterium bergeronii]
MGRPTDNPRDKQYRIRLTEDEEKKLAFCSEKSGKTKADILRIGLEKIYQEIIK